MRTSILSLVMLLALATSLFAKTVDNEQARVVATNYLKERIQNHQVDWSVNELSLSSVTTLNINGQPAIYVFSNQGKGFILVSAEDQLTPIFGYSYTGSFPEQGTAKNFESYLQEYVQQVNWVRTQSNYRDDEAQAAWVRYSLGSTNKSLLATNDVEPLMTCLWNQDSPYNDFCPEDAGGPGGHVYAGCVATAMSMIMYYYRYPVHGTGNHSYFCPGYGTQTVNYGTTYYDWDAMTDEIGNGSGSSIPAIALLQYQAGVAVNMQYGIDGSSAYSTDVPPAMISHFGFATSTQFLNRSSYTATNWENMVVEQLDAAKPLYYSGVDPTPTTGGGHAFICDGYQVTGSTKMFHFNFGWSGSGNGYYTLANPAPTGTPGFSTQQGMLRDAVPASSYPYGCSSRTITFPNGSFEDGSSPRANYNPNQNCTYLISPTDSVLHIYLTFTYFDVDPSDTLYVYDGVDDNAPLLGSFTGNTIPPSVSSTGKNMFLKFFSDGSVESKGWNAQYNSSFPSYCGGTEVLTDPLGTFADGSGANRYNNNVVCRWKIQPPMATGLTLYFNNFDVADDDQLLIYSLGTSTTLLQTLTGNQIPEPIVSPTNAFLLLFKSDTYNQAGGFDGYYTTTNVGTPELNSTGSFSLNPNPTANYSILRYYTREDINTRLSIYDLTGKEVWTDNVTFTKGNNEKRLDVGSLKSGMYFLVLNNAKGRISQKLIIQ